MAVNRVKGAMATQANTALPEMWSLRSKKCMFLANGGVTATYPYLAANLSGNDKLDAGSGLQSNCMTLDSDSSVAPIIYLAQAVSSEEAEILRKSYARQSLGLKRRISSEEHSWNGCEATRPTAKRQKPSVGIEQTHTIVKKPSHPLALLARTPLKTLILHKMPTYKQLNTTLYVYFPPLQEFVPLMLRSCMTMSSFFYTVLGAFEVQSDKVAALRIKFERVPGSPAEIGSWLIKRNVPDSYDMFLDVIDELSGWSGTTKCTIRVDIMRQP